MSYVLNIMVTSQNLWMRMFTWGARFPRHVDSVWTKIRSEKVWYSQIVEHAKWTSQQMWNSRRGSFNYK